MRKFLHSKEVVRTKAESNYLKDPSLFRIYTAKYNFFNVIDTEEKAYWLGFITADGHISDRELRIQLSIKDKNHLEKFLTAIESTHPIYDYETSSLVAIKSREIAKDLHRYGLTSTKTYSVKPHLLPKNLSRHYWRGIFDGDGHIAYHNNSNRKNYSGFHCILCGTKDICAGFKNFLNKNGIETNSAILPIRDTAAYKFATSGNQIVKSIHSLLYDYSNVSLDRKREVVCRGF